MANYTLELEVINTYGIFIVIVEEEEEVEEIEEEIEEVEEVKIIYPEVTAKIVQISNFGMVNITFSEEMFVNSTDLSWIDDDVLTMELFPYELPEDVDLSLLSFTWKAVKFEGENLDLKLSFYNPVYISLNKVQDKLTVNFNSTYFLSATTSEPLSESYS